MNERDFHAWADAIDNRPSYGSRTTGRILYMGAVEKRCRSAPWEISARRRRYQLRLMRARMEMEELL
jgi:hypothetical protein